MRGFLMMAAAFGALAACQPARAPDAAAAPNDFSGLVTEQRTIAQLREEMAGGGTAASLTQSYLDRIAAVDDAGPTLNAVLAHQPQRARRCAGARCGAGRRRCEARAPAWHSDPAQGQYRNAGSHGDDGRIAGAAGQCRRPRFSRWWRGCGRRARLFSARPISANGPISGRTARRPGWSAVGGQTKNPHVLDRNPCGSSSGSGAAVAAGLAAGRDRDGDGWLDRLPRFRQRYCRAEADRRAGPAHPHRADQRDAGHRRTDDADGGGRRPAADRDGRVRPERSGDDRG